MSFRTTMDKAIRTIDLQIEEVESKEKYGKLIILGRAGSDWYVLKNGINIKRTSNESEARSLYNRI